MNMYDVSFTYVEVRDSRRIDGTARTRAKDAADLRDYAARGGVEKENIGITAESDHAFLDPCSAGIIQPDAGQPFFIAEIHDLADLLGRESRKASHRKP